MFEPNNIGEIAPMTGRDIHAQPAYGAWRSCPFGIVNLAVGGEKTTVRADSSASRGSADETVAMRAKILIPAYIPVGIADKFRFAGRVYEVAAINPRYSVVFHIDHFEVDLAVLPE